MRKVFLLFLILLFFFPYFENSISANNIPNDLLISEYLEGTSNNKALEIYNPTTNSIDLGLNNYKIEIYFNGSQTAGLTINLTGTINPDGVFVLAHSSADPQILAKTNQTISANLYNGDDTIILKRGETILDVIGQKGFDPGIEWGTGLTSTQDNTLVRKCSITSGDPNPDDNFDPSLEWEGYPTDTFGFLGSHTLCLSSPTPTPQITQTPSPSPIETFIPEPSPTQTPSISSSPTPTNTQKPSPTSSPQVSPLPTITLSPTPTSLPIFKGYYLTCFLSFKNLNLGFFSSKIPIIRCQKKNF